MPLRLSDEGLEIAKAFPGRHLSVFGVPGAVLECPGGVFGGVGWCICALRGIWKCFLLNSHQYPWCTNKSTDIFQKT